MTDEVPPAPGGVIETLEAELAATGQRLRRAGRRSRRFSWFSWGFLFAVTAGIPLVSFALLYVGINCACFPGLSGGLVAWAIVLGTAPAAILLALAAREVILGRREALHPAAPASLRPTAATPVEEAGWTESIRRSQETLSQIKSEVEFSYVPLVLGLFSLVVVIAAYGLEALEPGLGLESILLPYLAGLPLLLLLIPLYLASRTWVRTYQALLDRQARGLSELESAFFSRFAAVAAPP